MICEHKECMEEADVIRCDNHINEDYPPDFKPLFKDIGKFCVATLKGKIYDIMIPKREWNKLMKKYGVNSSSPPIK